MIRQFSFRTKRTETSIEFRTFNLYSPSFEFRRFDSMFDLEIRLFCIMFQFEYDYTQYTEAYDLRYDLAYNLDTLEYTEEICKCSDENCEFRLAYEAAGSPTHYTK